MADIFLTEDVRKLFLNKFVVVMGGSVHRSIYKDLVMLLQHNKYLSDSQLRAKGEPTFENDELLEGGRKGIMKTNNNYREVRQYMTSHHLVRFYFMTRCFNKYMESVLKTLSQEPKPDVLIISTIVWDITRYGPTGIDEYKERLEQFFKEVKAVITNKCLVIWNTAPPVSKEAKGGIFTPEVEHLRSTFRLEVLEANYYAYQVAVKHGYNVLDLHYFLRLQLHRRAEDGIHWDMTAHRRMSNLLLTCISEQWKIPLPGNVNKMFKKKINANEKAKPGNIQIEKKALATKQEIQAASQINTDVIGAKQKSKKKKKNKNKGWNMQGSMMPNNMNYCNNFPNNVYNLQPMNCGQYNINEQRYVEQEYYAQEPHPLDNQANFQWQPYSGHDFVRKMVPGPSVARHHPFPANERQFRQAGIPHIYQPEFW